MKEYSTDDILYIVDKIKMAAFDFQLKIDVTKMFRDQSQIHYINGEHEMYNLRLKEMHELGREAIDSGIYLHKILEDYILENTNSIKINILEMQNFYDNMLNDLLKNNDGIQTSEGSNQ